MFVLTTEKNLRPGYGRDSLMFNHGMKQCKTLNWTSKMILESNSLPLNLRSIEHILDFRKKLKTHYFKQFYPNAC